MKISVVFALFVCLHLIGCRSEPTTLREDTEQAQEELAEAREQAAEIIADSEEDAVEIVADAGREAREHIQDARDDASDLVMAAEQKLERKLDELQQDVVPESTTVPVETETVGEGDLSSSDALNPSL